MESKKQLEHIAEMRALMERNDLSLKIVPQGEFTYISHTIEASPGPAGEDERDITLY